MQRLYVLGIVVFGLSLALSLVTTLGSGCKRPGTDRALNCERYADELLGRTMECGTTQVEGVTLTGDNVKDVAQKWAAMCEADKLINPTPDCVKAIRATACDGAKPSRKGMAACMNK